MSAAEVSTNQLILYISLAAAIIGIVSGAWPKLLQMFGQVGEAAQARLDRQRTTAKATDDADIEELKRGLANLQELLRKEQTDNALKRQLISELYLYILAAQQDPKNLARPVPDPREFLSADDSEDPDLNNLN